MDKDQTPLYPAEMPADTPFAQQEASALAASLTSKEIEEMKIYFERLATEMLASFNLQLKNGYTPINFLDQKLEDAAMLLGRLQLPWNRYIPVIYQACSFYFIHTTEIRCRKQALGLTSELMSLLVFLSQSGPLIHHLCEFANTQSRMLKLWMEQERKEEDKE